MFRGNDPSAGWIKFRFGFIGFGFVKLSVMAKFVAPPNRPKTFALNLSFFKPHPQRNDLEFMMKSDRVCGRRFPTPAPGCIVQHGGLPDLSLEMPDFSILTASSAPSFPLVVGIAWKLKPEYRAVSFRAWRINCPACRRPDFFIACRPGSVWEIVV